MRIFRNLFILAIAVLGISSIDVSAQTNAFGRNTSFGIEKDVRKEILMLPYYDVFDAISFKVDGDTVYLYGKVNEPITKSQAERYVKDVKGVSEVVNNIEVLPPSSFDNQIRWGIVREFDRRGGSIYRYLQGTNPSMRIIVDGGHVSLEGFVANRSDANLANILANGVFGVFSVKNNLIIESELIR